MNLFGDSFIRWRGQSGTDKYGNPITVWDETGKTTVTGVSVQPAYDRDASEPDRIISIKGLTIITAPGMDMLEILSTDRVLYGTYSGWFTLEGEVTRYNVGGTLHHATARVKKVS